MDGIQDNPATPAVVADNAPASAPAPVAPISEPVAPAAEPVAPATQTPPAPAVDAPSTDAPATDAPAESDADNILGGTEKPAEEKPAEEKPADAPKEGDKPAEEVKPADEPAPLPVYEEFKLPDGYSADPESIGEFSKLLGELETAAGKLDHKGYQEAGQKLIDLGTKNVQQSIERLNEYYTQFHENQKKEWFESFKKDPEMGGEKLQETVSTLRTAVEQYGGNAEQVAEFRKIMKETGVGNHPAVTRLLYNMQQKINKYETESGGNRIVPGQKPAPSKVKPYQQFYGGN
jgi:hypothetical protein